MKLLKWLASLWCQPSPPVYLTRFEFTKPGEAYDCEGWLYSNAPGSEPLQHLSESVAECIEWASGVTGVALINEIDVEQEPGDYYYGYWEGEVKLRGEAR